MSYQPKGRRGSSSSRRMPAGLLLSLAVVVTVLAVVLFSPLFWLQDVSVQGAKKVDPTALADVVRAASERDFALLQSSSLMIVNETAVETAVLKRFPDIATVSVEKRLPNTLIIKIEERAGVLTWVSNNQSYRIDQEGVAYEKETKLPSDDDIVVVDASNLPVEIGKPVVGSNFIGTLGDIRTAFRDKGITITKFEVVDTTFEVRAVTDRGFYVLLDTTRSAENQAAAAVAALQSAKPGSYLDVRVPGRVYVR